ncbi:MAG TPA: hypothetical protein VGF99_00060 [Myxococcota bacterium]
MQNTDTSGAIDAATMPAPSTSPASSTSTSSATSSAKKPSSLDTSARTITQELRDLDRNGVTESFRVLPKSQLRCEHCGMAHAAKTMTLLDVRRLEGASDPTEMAAVLTLRCGHCQGEGSCVVSFGPMASAEDQDVMLALGADERV